MRSESRRSPCGAPSSGRGSGREPVGGTPSTPGKASVNWRNYLTGYRVRFTPTASVARSGSAVTRSSVEDDPFDGLACPGRPFEIADLVDVRQDFEDEVEAYRGQGIGAGGQFQVPQAHARFGAIVTPEDCGEGGDWRPLMSLELKDMDGDPKYDDFGKVDFDGNGKADNTATIDDESSACTASDGAAGCDAELTFDLSATFTRIRDTDTCTHTIEQGITCTWDADRDKPRGGANRFDVRTAVNESPDRNHFIRCEPS